jgi:hypothetical protein
MKKLFLICAVLVMALSANAQTNQYFWYNGNLLMGNAITQIDSVTFGNGESTDTLHILLPRTIIKEVRDTVTITVHDTIYINKCVPKGAVDGAFSVSANKQVFFSKGNLQYQASTDTWRFAENQYDIIGESNASISSSYTGWIDLFGWGTGGNPTYASPYSSDYTTFVEWGINAISNAGNVANEWHTLTRDEWYYIFFTRANASTLFAMGNVNGINGIIVLPDNWTIPTGANFLASTTLGLSAQNGNIGIIYTSNSSNNFFTTNVYTKEQWAVMEAAGAVFLPAAGRRAGTTVTSVKEKGDYWSISPYPTEGHEGQAVGVTFSSYNLNPQASVARGLGSSVRLVQDVE